VTPASARTRRATADERAARVARRRFARRQWARRWLTWRPVLAVAGLVAVCAGGSWLLFFSSVLTVDTVRVEGSAVLAQSEVRRVAAVPLGTPLASVPLDAIAARVEGLAPVASADVSRSWPDAVRIAVVEREAVAVVERDGVLRGLDDEGVVFRTFPAQPAGLPLVRMSAGTRTEALAEAASVIDALPADLAGRVDHVAVDTVDSISLRLRNGREIFWGSADGSATKAEVVEVLLEQKASVYDVSVPGQPTIRR
jgi:cell division protein FtsQ